MSEHFGAVEADFQSHYGLDLRTVLWGPARSGVRRILSLIRGLPADGATVRMLSTGGVPWSMTDELLATLIEVIDQGNQMYYSAHTRKGSPSWKPIRIDRPTQSEPTRPKPQKRVASAEEVEAFFGRNIKRTNDEVSVDG